MGNRKLPPLMDYFKEVKDPRREMNLPAAEAQAALAAGYLVSAT
jgi:hypothetical protein